MDNSNHAFDSPYEMSLLSIGQGDSQTATPMTLSTQSSMAALRVADPDQGVTVQELPPVDRGIRAWTFCAAGFVLEMMVWGFGFRFAFYSSVNRAVTCVLTLIIVMVSSKVPYRPAGHVSLYSAETSGRLLHYASTIQHLVECRHRCRWYGGSRPPVRRGKQGASILLIYDTLLT